MHILELLQQSPQYQLHNASTGEDFWPQYLIESITLDSRTATSQSIFVALPGQQIDGRKFIKQCPANIILVDQWDNFWQNNIRSQQIIIEVPNARHTMALWASALCGHPSKKMTCIGLTGTNGKTTTTWMLAHILRTQNLNVGTIGTIGHQFNGQALNLQDGHTTPESPQLQQILQYLLQKNCQVCIMEVSSIGLQMHRVDGIFFDIAAFTNWTQDHLDFHASMQEYLEAKQLLFQNHVHPNSISILNGWQEAIKNTAVHKGHRELFGYEKGCDWQIIDHQLSLQGCRFVFEYQQHSYTVNLPIIGAHNIENAITAIACAHGVGIQIPNSISALENLPQTPGRLELVHTDTPWSAFVDYAHTPDALEKSLQSLRSLTKGKVIVVFGCGGDRDKEKRPIMGQIASRLADICIVTSDNPRSENPQQILNEILLGISADFQQSPACHALIDRQDAILKAVELVRDNDCILIAGKGHENYQILGQSKIHFDDREAVSKAIEILNK